MMQLQGRAVMVLPIEFILLPALWWLRAGKNLAHWCRQLTR